MGITDLPRHPKGRSAAAQSRIGSTVTGRYGRRQTKTRECRRPARRESAEVGGLDGRA